MIEEPDAETRFRQLVEAVQGNTAWLKKNDERLAALESAVKQPHDRLEALESTITHMLATSEAMMQKAAIEEGKQRKVWKALMEALPYVNYETVFRKPKDNLNAALREALETTHG